MAGDNVGGCGGGLCWRDVYIDDVGVAVSNNIEIPRVDFRIYNGDIQFRARRKNGRRKVSR